MLFKDTVKALRMLKAKRGDKTYSATLDFLMKKYGEEK